jgi:mRNA interferase MazF
MTDYSKGDILLVPFPFSDLSTTKKRPAVVIGSDHLFYGYPDIIIMPITSRISDSHTRGDCILHEWKNAGLLKPSAVKPVITTIEKSLVQKKLGFLTQRDRNALDETLKEILELQ